MVNSGLPCSVSTVFYTRHRTLFRLLKISLRCIRCLSHDLEQHWLKLKPIQVEITMIVRSAMIVVFLLTVRVARSSLINSRDSRLDNILRIHAVHSSDTVHNITIDCGTRRVLIKNAWQCQWDLCQVAGYGYPWYPKSSQRNSRYKLNAPDRNITLRDALDSLNHMCHTYDRSQTCLEEKGIQDYCLATINPGLVSHVEFQFICHQQQRDENLVRSLQCLYDNRLMVMLYFHIAGRCRGMGILDGIMRHYKNAMFYAWNIKPVMDQASPRLSLYCIPRSVIQTCIRGIVEDHCGTMTADLVQKYLVSPQGWYGQTLQSAGLNSNICDRDISSDLVPSRLPIPSGHTRLTISRLLEVTAAGTALDTYMVNICWPMYRACLRKTSAPLPVYGWFILHVSCPQTIGLRLTNSTSYSLHTNSCHSSTTGLSVADWRSLQHAGT